MKVKTVVLIPNYNGRRWLEKCFTSLRCQTDSDFAVVVSDDGSLEDDVQWLRDYFPAVDVLPLSENHGFVRAVNAGLIYARKKYQPRFIAVLNNDTRVAENWLSALVARAETDPRIAAVTSNMLFTDYPNIVNSQGGTISWNGDGSDVNFGVRRELSYAHPRDVLGACFGAALLNAAALDTVGLLDEKFYAYFEDLDWSWRAQLFGYRIVFEPTAVVYHKGSASFGKKQYRKLFLTKRNALRCAIKNYARDNLSERLHYILLGDWFYFIGYLFQQSDANDFSFGKRLRYSLIPLWSILWNIIHLPSALAARRMIQNKRMATDNEIGVLPHLDEKIDVDKESWSLHPITPPFHLPSQQGAAASREAAFIKAACLFSLGLVGYWGSDHLVVATQRSTSSLEWARVSTLARNMNAASQVYFYVRALALSGNAVPAAVVLSIKREGSRIQNFFLSRINMDKYLRGKRSFLARVYAAAYLEPTLLQHLVAAIHAWYNQRRGEASGKYQAGSGTAMQTTVPFGLNVFGFFNSESGVGEAARSLVRILQAARLPFALINSEDNPHRKLDTTCKGKFSAESPYGTNVIAIYGDVFADALRRLGRERLQNQWNIAYWAWELDTLPEKWQAALKEVNEVWVPSTFVRAAVLKACNLPVTVIPHAIVAGKRFHGREHFSLPHDKFIFLFTFDFYSIFERKNPLAVIKAFKTAFQKNENVHLAMKCSNSDVDGENFERMKSAAQDARITIMDGYLSRAEISSLLSITDCYVSLHRSEGFGLTIAEAMSIGKPVIATAYSGNMDFMNEENSFPVDYRRVEIKQDYGPYTKGNFWAEPDSDHAAKLMRLVFGNPDIRLRRALRAREDVATKLNPEVIGEKIKARLRELEILL